MPGEEDVYVQELGADISATGTLVTLNKGGFPYLSLQIGDGTESADYQLQVSQDRENWFDTEISFTAVTKADGGGVVPERYARVQVTAAASNGSTADILLVASK